MKDEELDAQAAEFVTVVGRIMRQMSTLSDGDEAMDLPIAQLRLCNLLTDGEQTMSHLGSHLGISPSAVTQIADRLESSGLLQRVSGSDDRRCKYLRLTEKGADIIERRGRRKRERAMKALERLSPTQRQETLSTMQVFLAAITDSSDADI